jgi:Kunitz/Bovine pancreatic trypsin inhibitor domain/von Willebrand factor type C domain
MRARVRSWAVASVLACVSLVGCGDDDSGDAAVSGAGSGGSSGSAAGSAAGKDAGGQPTDSGTPVSDSGPSRDAGGDAQSGTLCELPPETGRCRATVERWYYDPTSGRCETFTYGGCEGNANNFEMQMACEEACGPLAGGATACEVGGKVYPSGTGGIADPFSCNECTCNDGALGCTKIACPKDCPAGTTPGKSCSQCGPADGCEVVRTGCLPECDSQADCQGTGLGQCFDGVCRILCG